MRTTLDLPDDLMRRVKIRAAEDGKKLKEVMEELLVAGFRASGSSASRETPPTATDEPAPRPSQESSEPSLANSAIDASFPL